MINIRDAIREGMFKDLIELGRALPPARESNSEDSDTPKFRDLNNSISLVSDKLDKIGSAMLVMNENLRTSIISRQDTSPVIDVEAISKAITNSQQNILDRLPNYSNTNPNLGSNFKEDIGLVEINKSLYNVTVKLNDSVSDLSGKIDDVNKSITSLNDSLKSNGGLPNLRNIIPLPNISGMIGSARDKISGVAGSIRDRASNAVNSVRSGISNTVSGTVNAVKGGVSGVINTVKGGASGALNAVASVKDRVSGAYSSAKDKVSSSVSALKDKVKNKFSSDKQTNADINKGATSQAEVRKVRSEEEYRVGVLKYLEEIADSTAKISGNKGGGLFDSMMDLAGNLLGGLSGLASALGVPGLFGGDSKKGGKNKKGNKSNKNKDAKSSKNKSKKSKSKGKKPKGLVGLAVGGAVVAGGAIAAANMNSDEDDEENNEESENSTATESVSNNIPINNQQSTQPNQSNNQTSTPVSTGINNQTSTTSANNTANNSTPLSTSTTVATPEELEDIEINSEKEDTIFDDTLRVADNAASVADLTQTPLEKSAAKLAAKSSTNAATKVGSSALSGAAKVAGKVVKVIPGIGLVTGISDMHDRAREGDYTGAMLAGLSAAASIMPHGALVSLGLDAVNGVRDNMGISDDRSEEEKELARETYDQSMSIFDQIGSDDMSVSTDILDSYIDPKEIVAQKKEIEYRVAKNQEIEESLGEQAMNNPEMVSEDSIIKMLSEKEIIDDEGDQVTSYVDNYKKALEKLNKDKNDKDAYEAVKKARGETLRKLQKESTKGNAEQTKSATESVSTSTPKAEPVTDSSNESVSIVAEQPKTELVQEQAESQLQPVTNTTPILPISNSTPTVTGDISSPYKVGNTDISKEKFEYTIPKELNISEEELVVKYGGLTYQSFLKLKETNPERAKNIIMASIESHKKELAKTKPSTSTQQAVNNNLPIVASQSAPSTSSDVKLSDEQSTKIETSESDPTKKSTETSIAQPIQLTTESNVDKVSDSESEALRASVERMNAASQSAAEDQFNLTKKLNEKTLDAEEERQKSFIEKLKTMLMDLLPDWMLREGSGQKEGASGNIPGGPNNAGGPGPSGPGGAQGPGSSNAPSLGDMSGKGGNISAYEGLGDVMSKYETGGKGTASISNTAGDVGGASYGKAQLSHKMGSLKEFVDSLKDKDPQMYQQLSSTYGSAGQGKQGQFGQTWMQLSQNANFRKYESEFIGNKFLSGPLSKLKSDSLKQKIQSNPAIQEMFLSTTINHGAGGGVETFNKVYKEGMSDEEFIKGIYQERANRASKSGNSDKIKESLYNRYKKEANDILALHGKMGQSQPSQPAQPTQPSPMGGSGTAPYGGPVMPSLQDSPSGASSASYGPSAAPSGAPSVDTSSPSSTGFSLGTGGGFNSNQKGSNEAPATTSGGSDKAAKAADFVTQSASSKSQGACAKFVRTGLQKAGYQFQQQPSAYQYATNGIMESMGFSQISPKDPHAKGDVAVIGESSKHKHGHIQIWNGQTWVSDFVQNPNKLGPYSGGTGVDSDQFYKVYRDTGGASTGYTGGDEVATASSNTDSSSGSGSLGESSGGSYSGGTAMAASNQSSYGNTGGGSGSYNQASVQQGPGGLVGAIAGGIGGLMSGGGISGMLGGALGGMLGMPMGGSAPAGGSGGGSLFSGLFGGSNAMAATLTPGIAGATPTGSGFNFNPSEASANINAPAGSQTSQSGNAPLPPTDPAATQTASSAPMPSGSGGGASAGSTKVPRKTSIDDITLSALNAQLLH